MHMTTLRVAVIGAGCSGLAAIKCCLDEGIEPVCFEKSEGIGGLWRYSDVPTPGRAGVYKTTTINTSKELLAYSTFPPPAEFPNFMHHSKLYKYMTLYAQHYSLVQHIKFGTEVTEVRKAEDSYKTGRWIVSTRTAECDNADEMFDAVMVCTGHHAYPNNPAESIPGYNSFKGRATHAHEYRSPKPFEDRRVVVVGLGNTGGDLAVELSRNAKKAYLSTRRGAWVINRIVTKGIPFDLEVVTRAMNLLMKILPFSVLNWSYEKKVNDRFDHELYGLKPKHRVLSQHPLVNDELPARIANGTVEILSDITSFRENGVVTSDGKLHLVDDVIFATGYVIKYPFLPRDVVSVDDRNNLSPLYKLVFPLNLGKNPTLALIGNVQPLGGLIPIAEMQSRWATRVFKGLAELPRQCDMMTEVERRQRNLNNRYVNTLRHTIQIDYLNYMDDIAEEIAVKPDLYKLFIESPMLAWKVLVGPATSYQYRLQGVGKWEGAKHAIDTQWDRVVAGFGKGGKSQDTTKKTIQIKSKTSENTFQLDLVSKLFRKSLHTRVLVQYFLILVILMSATLLVAFPL